MNIGDTFKSVTKGMPVLLTGGQPGYRAGDDKLAWNCESLIANATFEVVSPAFQSEGVIPAMYGADGDNMSPPLAWSGSIESVRSFTLVVEDPDAPTPEPFVHWLLYNIPAPMRQLPENIVKEPVAVMAGDAQQGKNSSLKVGWTGMAPPKGDTSHRYFFQMFALDKRLELAPGAGRSALFDAMAGHVIARGRLIGTFQRS